MSAAQPLPEITVSIVSMNNVACLTRCLSSMYQHHDGLALEVIVVFYRTPDDVVRRITTEFPQVQVVISGSESTRGYGENQNLGLRRGRGKYQVILNDDIVFLDDALRQLRDYHNDHPELGALHPKLLNEDGSVQLAIRGRFTPFNFVLNMLHLNPLLSRFPKVRPLLFDEPLNDSLEPVVAESGSGAFFWVRSEVLVDVGYMDERYFLAPDDVDLSIRIVRAGSRMKYLPNVAAIHTGGSTLSKVFSKVLPVNLFGVTDLFRTHYGRVAAAAVMGTIVVHSAGSAAYWAGEFVWGDRTRARTMLRGRANLARFLFTRRRSSKEIFLGSW